jgi:hypothetical protein
MARFGLSSFTLADLPGSYRLHSRVFTIQCRIFSMLLLGCAFQLLDLEMSRTGRGAALLSLAYTGLLFVAVLAVAAYLWRRPKRIVATKEGLEVGTGKKQRVIPWSRVLDVRELPWVRVNPPWSPRMWQVDLDRGEHFDFCGTREARQIVRDYIARAEGPKHEG